MKKHTISTRAMWIATTMVLALLLPALACAQGGVSGTVKTDVYTATADLTVTDTEIIGTVVFTDIPDKVCESALSLPEGSFWNAYVLVDEGKLEFRTTSFDGSDSGPVKADRLYDEFAGLAFGEESDKVRAFQQKLADIGYYGSEISGVYDAYTAAAAMMVQSIRFCSSPKVMNEGLNFKLAVPVADDETIAAISAETGGMLDGVKGPISLSSQSDDVRRMQEALRKLRIYNGESTGNVGTKTEKAIMYYRVTRGLDDTDFNLAFAPDYVLIAGEQALDNLDGAITDSGEGTCTLHVRYALPQDTGDMALRPANTQVVKWDITLK